MTTMPDNNLSVTLPADHIPGLQQGDWTFDDYRALPDDGKRYEVMTCGAFKGNETLPSRIAPGIANLAVERFFFHEPN